MCGINTKYHNAGVGTRGNINAGARELKINLNRSKSYIEAIWYYKGRVSLGLRQAKHVGEIYDKINIKIPS